MHSAMAQVFNSGEVARLRRIAVQLAKVDAKPAADVGNVMDSPANKMVEMVVRIAAARHGGSMGAGRWVVASKPPTSSQNALGRHCVI
ncbi:hypothetical protein CUR85_18835 [Sulfitobacter faviae]|nr:hypothetical protein [Sulfitobacter faviae]